MSSNENKLIELLDEQQTAYQKLAVAMVMFKSFMDYFNEEIDALAMEENG